MRQIEDAKAQVSQSEENAKEMRRQVMAAQSESEKTKLLLEEKIVYLEKQLEEAQEKEKEMSQELKSRKRESILNTKE